MKRKTVRKKMGDVKLWYFELPLLVIIPLIFLFFTSDNSITGAVIGVQGNIGTLAVPTQGTPILNTTDPRTNNTNTNLTAYNTSTSDTDGDLVKNIYNWNMNGSSLTLLNMPFEGINGTTTDNALDYSGNGNDGTETGGVVWNSTGGYDGRGAYKSNGNDSYILLSKTTYPRKISIFAWVKPNETSAPSHEQVIVAYSASRFSYTSDTGQLRFYPNVAGGPTISNTAGDGSNVNEWHHVGIVYDFDFNSTNGNGTFYFDGSPINSFVGTNDTSLQNLIYIGSYGASLYFHGYIDEVLIFNRTLSAEQVSALYKNQSNLIVSQEIKKNETWSVDITPNDGSNDGASARSNNVTILNGAPIFDPSLVDKTSKVGDLFTYNINCTDPDSDNVTYYDNSTFYNINSSTGLINYTITQADVGIHTINITCGDGELNTSETFIHTIGNMIFINAVNTSSNFRINENFTANITIENSEGTSNLSYYIFSTNASGSWVNTTEINISGTQYNASNSANITIVKNSQSCWYYWANNTLGNSSVSSTYCFTVQDTPPAFNHTLENKTANYGVPFTYDINCSDVDTDSITYYDNSDFFNIDSSTGVISGTFTRSDAEGSFYINITCGDGSLNSSKTFTLALDDKNPAPTLFNTTFYQTPARMEPNDLLVLPGYNLKSDVTVVYQLVNDSPGTLSSPSSVPSSNTSVSGQFRVVSYTNLPDSVTVLVPNVTLTKAPYVIWVKNAGGNWSNPVFVNDIRPLWITPSRFYSTERYASLPRILKVVGRNMESNDTSSPTQVKLKGPSTYTLTSTNDNSSSTAIEIYAAMVNLPATLNTGNYSVEVSRDGKIWLNTSQTLEVLKDPTAKTRFNVADYGCTASDGQDDTLCVVYAIGNASANSGGGEVYFSSGTWLLGNTTGVPGSWVDNHGITLPQYVDLLGAGIKNTIIEKAKSWNSTTKNDALAVFSIDGDNMIRNITFLSDGWNNNNSGPRMIGLGKRDGQRDAGDPNLIKNVIITGNNFSGMYNGITGIVYPLANIYITKNYFQAYDLGMNLLGTDNYKNIMFYVNDSVFDNNIFYPGDYKDVDQGTIASQFSGAYRVDFSNNSADGTVNGGWRAAYFWTHHDNSEMMLVSQNNATCTGDKTGDGEFISYDNNGDKVGFNNMASVLGADKDTVTIDVNWLNDTPLYPASFNGHWIFVVDGKGLGQVRKIVNYTDPGLSVVYVTPSWDVIPDYTSRVMVLSNYWNVYAIDNNVDMRPCAKTNYINQSGIIGLTITTDSVVEGNKQYQSDGILAISTFIQNDSKLTYFNEIRNNIMQDGYPGGVHGGIKFWWGSDAGSQSGVVSYANSISHNIVNNSDTLYGGGISFEQTYSAPSTPYQQVNNLVFSNVIENSTTAGIYIRESYTWDTVLYNNTLNGFTTETDIVDSGTNTTYVNFCGNGIVESGEECDDGNRINDSCDYNAGSCTICNSNCKLVAGTEQYCGNGVCEYSYESSSNCAQDCGTICPSGIVSWWSADGTLSDSVSSNDGTFTGDATYGPGKAGQAFLLDGTGDGVDLETSKNLQNLTFVAWANTTGANGNDQAFLDYEVHFFHM